MPNTYHIPDLPFAHDLETKAVLKQLNEANKKLAELKGLAKTIPNENILINSLSLQEAKESSEVENIVTTNDELYKADLNLQGVVVNASTKEVLRYREALKAGFERVRKNKILSLNDIIGIQCELVGNRAGFRAQPGTKLIDGEGKTIYMPPQDPQEVQRLMKDLEAYINRQELQDIDPLIKMAVIHHQFESIHPFLDGNGRTGRIIAILYLIISDTLDLPILYLSRYITRNKSEYYRLIQLVRDTAPDNFAAWEEWVIFMLKGVKETAEETIDLVGKMQRMMTDFKNILRPAFGRQYKHELLNNLFFHPYTKIDFFERELQIERKTATRYLDRIVELGLLEKIKVWRTNYYMNIPLINLFLNHSSSQTERTESIESVTPPQG